jgi:propionate CoA-transferase
MSNEIRNPLAPAQASTKKSKIVSAEDAIQLIKTGDMIATTGIVGCVLPEHLLIGIEQAFLSEGRPRDLRLMIASQ